MLQILEFLPIFHVGIENFAIICRCYKNRKKYLIINIDAADNSKLISGILKLSQPYNLLLTILIARLNVITIIGPTSSHPFIHPSTYPYLLKLQRT